VHQVWASSALMPWARDYIPADGNIGGGDLFTHSASGVTSIVSAPTLKSE